MNEPKYKVGQAVWADNQPAIVKDVKIAQDPYYKKPGYRYSIEVSYALDVFEHHVAPREVPKYSDGDIVLINIPEGDWKAKVRYSHADDEGKNVYEVELITRKFEILEEKIKEDNNE